MCLSIVFSDWKTRLSVERDANQTALMLPKESACVRGPTARLPTFSLEHGHRGTLESNFRAQGEAFQKSHGELAGLSAGSCQASMAKSGCDVQRPFPCETPKNRIDSGNLRLKGFSPMMLRPTWTRSFRSGR